MAFPYAKYSELKSKGRIGTITDHVVEGVVVGKIVPLKKTDPDTGESVDDCYCEVKQSSLESYRTIVQAADASAEAMERDLFPPS